MDTNNIFDFVWKVVDSSIRNEVCNGKQCYRFSYGSGFIYVEKETGLPIRLTGISSIINENENSKTDAIVDYYYKFNCVTDKDFVEPDISEYEIQK